MYPAHPAPRTPYSFTHSHYPQTRSPVLSRGPSSDEVVRIHHKTPDERSTEDAFERVFEESRVTTSSGSAEASGGSGTTAVDDLKNGTDDDEDEDLEEELQNAETRDWARRVSGDELKRIDISGKGKGTGPP